MRLVWMGWAMAMAAAPCCELAHAQSLRDLFVAGLTADPTVVSSEAQYRASEERIRQARSAILPNIELTGSTSASRFHPDDGRDDREFHTDRWAIQLTQPLYRPESLTEMDTAKAELQIAEVQLEAATADLAARMTSAFIDILAAREAALSFRREQAAAEEQLAAAKRSFTQGTVAVTDVFDAEAKRDVAVAQKDAAENDLALKRELFAQLIGGGEFELNVLPRSSPDPSPIQEELRLLLDEAIERNPFTQDAKLRLDTAKLAVRKARAGHLPTLDLVISYGSDQSTGTPSNPIPVHGDTAQAQASLRMPLFSGFGTSAKIGEALALEDKARAELETAERRVATSVREAYYGVKSALGQITSLETAEKSTDIAVRAQRKGYRVGTSTTAEVLKAEALFSQARRDLMKAKLDARLNRIKLQIALGRPWRESVDELSNQLIPEQRAEDIVMAPEAGVH